MLFPASETGLALDPLFEPLPTSGIMLLYGSKDCF